MRRFSADSKGKPGAAPAAGGESTLAARKKGGRGPRLRSKKYPAVQKRWSKLKPKRRKADVLRAMCEVAGVPAAVIEDRLEPIELAETPEPDESDE